MYMDMKHLTIFLLSFLCVVEISFGSLHSKDLCEVEGCSCSDDRLEVYCKCPHKEVIRIGDPQHSAGVSTPPESTRKLMIDECHHVEIMSQAFNKLHYIRNVTLNKAHSIVIHPRIFNSRQSQIGSSLPLENFKISNVRNLEVRRHSFEGIEIYGTFSLNNVLLKSVPSLSFSFDLVNEFEIIGSRIHRISMWGIKLPKCHEFRSTEKTQYFSLSSHALFMSCQNFLLLRNVFGSLHDASMNVSYRYAEIRKNTFETITGKPFINLRHNSPDGSFIFRENKFRVDSSLPEDALSMPNFDGSVDSYIDSNHFVCDCDKLAWLIYSTKEAFTQESKEVPTSIFLKELVKSSGKCLNCDLRGCSLGKKEFRDFLKNIEVSKTSEGYTCSKEATKIKEIKETTPVSVEITPVPVYITQNPFDHEYEELLEKEEKEVMKVSRFGNVQSIQNPESKRFNVDMVGFEEEDIDHGEDSDSDDIGDDYVHNNDVDHIEANKGGLIDLPVDGGGSPNISPSITLFTLMIMYHLCRRQHQLRL
ncbi:uncharacterized protein [Lepeophtheirus salmonis]|uniref:uncharacterized protein n=1 Tax=Lepeophtheirus salmonis TaxID=72036 RepID=UPI001AE18A5C|nr:uncharacterized protein LOC121117699 [Lepeophtheirus salmonis]XP_040568111.1 uncharacterized protein LOC121117699 [Lepeophtheirus salmonis]XP_040568112.1 uncharacterized protein LOC121117699 [Lepeophtheirus salmonis]